MEILTVGDVLNTCQRIISTKPRPAKNKYALLEICMDNIAAQMILENAKINWSAIDYYNRWAARTKYPHIYKDLFDTYVVAKLLGFITINLTIPNNRRINYMLTLEEQ